MDHDIIQNRRGRQHETPVKGEGSPRAAASPAGLLVPDGDAVVSAAGELLEVGGSFWKIFFGSGNIPLRQGSTLCRGQIGDWFGSLSALLLQISGDDPMLSVCENVADVPVAGA